MHGFRHAEIPVGEHRLEEARDLAVLAAVAVPVFQQGERVVAVVAAEGAEVVGLVVVEIVGGERHEAWVTGLAGEALFGVVEMVGHREAPAK
ncbi:hypothetical protein D3C85_1735620 [compost metagenome]